MIQLSARVWWSNKTFHQDQEVHYWYTSLEVTLKSLNIFVTKAKVHSSLARLWNFTHSACYVIWQYFWNNKYLTLFKLKRTVNSRSTKLTGDKTFLRPTGPSHLESSTWLRTELMQNGPHTHKKPQNTVPADVPYSRSPRGPRWGREGKVGSEPTPRTGKPMRPGCWHLTL